MGCGMGMIKYLLFIFNFIFAVCGLGILTLGVIVHLHDVSEHLDTNLVFPSITLIVIGSIIFVISFFGCCGAIRESHCMTITFASFLLFILLVQVAVGVYAFVVVKNVEGHLNVTTKYRTIFDGSFTNEQNLEFVNVVQGTLSCCGVDSKHDYDNRGVAIPWSCCGKPEGQNCTAVESYNQGCATAIKHALSTAGDILGGVAIGIAGVELLGIIFALCLANSIKNAERRGYRV